MALMYIAEYDLIPLGPEGSGIQVPQEPPLAVQVITFGASVASVEFQDETKIVSIQLDTNGHTQFGASPTATTTTSRLHEANAVSFHGVSGGQKIAAITA